MAATVLKMHAAILQTTTGYLYISPQAYGVHVSRGHNKPSSNIKHTNPCLPWREKPRYTTSTVSGAVRLVRERLGSYRLHTRRSRSIVEDGVLGGNSSGDLILGSGLGLRFLGFVPKWNTFHWVLMPNANSFGQQPKTT